MQYLSPFPGFSKTQVLVRREEELRHALKRHESQEAIIKKAERLRDAKKYLIKALQHALAEKQLTNSSLGNKREKNLKQAADFWAKISANEIIEFYQHPERTVRQTLPDSHESQAGTNA